MRIISRMGPVRAGLSGLLLGALLLVLAGAPRGSDTGGESAAAGDGRLSLLALGDTGHPPGAIPALSGQRMVARALADVDRADPVDGLLLLGDNFYPDGLKERKFKDRLRENVAAPYCHFLALTDRGRGSLSEACPQDSDGRHPVPVFAVLGNHDHSERESPLLQSKRIPQYLDWRMPRGLVEVHELEGGVSLILLQSMEALRGASLAPLAQVLKRSRGPWRILAAHHPMADSGRGYDPRYARNVVAAIDAAGVPVHLFLAGHEHNLQVFEMESPAPRLHVVAGSGSEFRLLRTSSQERLFAAEALGFVRVDAGDPAAPGLHVTVYEVKASMPLGLGGTARPVSRWRIRESGNWAPHLPRGEEAAFAPAPPRD